MTKVGVLKSTPRKRTNITKILAKINQSNVNFGILYQYKMTNLYLFVLMRYIPVKIFQSCGDEFLLSFVEPVLCNIRIVIYTVRHKLSIAIDIDIEDYLTSNMINIKHKSQ